MIGPAPMNRKGIDISFASLIEEFYQSCNKGFRPAYFMEIRSARALRYYETCLHNCMMTPPNGIIPAEKCVA